ncbi:hypothetical protein J4457_01060 [Candidatus Woesearchaeota archaeon]|nr:hypothetical protein [Candidatus Woesearchaeota archaeon]
MECAAIGGSEFTLGFRLAGLRKVVDLKGEKDITALMQDEQVGVLFMDQKTFDPLQEDLKEKIVTSLKPVCVVVSDKPQEELRKMIIRSIGVDLLREER